jgi:hypothetical protein
MHGGAMKLKRTPMIRTLALLYLIVFVALALYNPPLKPEVAEFLKLPVDNIADADNGFFAMYGFTAPANKDMHTFGLTQYKEYMDAAKNKNYAKLSTKYSSTNKLNFKGNDLPKENFYQFAAESTVALNRLAKDNAVLLSRYYKLRRYKNSFEPVNEESFQALPIIPSFASIRNSQTLSLLLAIRQAQLGHMDTAIKELESDLNFWQTALPQGRFLISKIIAISAIQRNYQMLSELVKHKDLTDRQQKQILALLPKWTPDQLQMGESFRFEAQFASESLNRTTATHRWLERLFFKKDATRNRYVQTFMEIGKTADLTAYEFNRSIKTNTDALSDRLRLHPDFLYNSVGSILNWISVSQVSAYIYKAHDLEVKRRMLLIQLKAKETKTGYTGMNALLKQLGPEYANPYTNQPMQWDEKKKAIYIDSTQDNKSEKKRLELPI